MFGKNGFCHDGAYPMLNLAAPNSLDFQTDLEFAIDRLEPRKIPFEFFIIDSAEKPPELIGFWGGRLV